MVIGGSDIKLEDKEFGLVIRLFLLIRVFSPQSSGPSCSSVNLGLNIKQSFSFFWPNHAF